MAVIRFFQDTIARNMAYCDEFVVVTNREYQFIVENQLKSISGADLEIGSGGRSA